jgi:hypothetical protein
VGEVRTVKSGGMQREEVKYNPGLLFKEVRSHQAENQFEVSGREFLKVHQKPRKGELK